MRAISAKDFVREAETGEDWREGSTPQFIEGKGQALH